MDFDILYDTELTSNLYLFDHADALPMNGKEYTINSGTIALSDAVAGLNFYRQFVGTNSFTYTYMVDHATIKKLLEFYLYHAKTVPFFLRTYLTDYVVDVDDEMLYVRGNTHVATMLEKRQTKIYIPSSADEIKYYSIVNNGITVVGEDTQIEVDRVVLTGSSTANIQLVPRVRFMSDSFKSEIFHPKSVGTVSSGKRCVPFDKWFRVTLEFLEVQEGGC